MQSVGSWHRVQGLPGPAVLFSPLPVRGGACGRGESHAGRCCTPRFQGLCSCLSPVSLRLVLARPGNNYTLDRPGATCTTL